MQFNKQTTNVKSSASEAYYRSRSESYMLKVYNYMGSGVAFNRILFSSSFLSGGYVTSLMENGIIGLNNFGQALLCFSVNVGSYVSSAWA